MTLPSPRIAITGTGLAEDVEGALDISGIDPGRLRRMDRFGRLGFFAGSLALREAEAARPAGACGPAHDPARSGIVFGTSFGCRDSVTDHALLVATTTRSDELSPGLFAQTVHNAVNGELAIAWGLGGVSEVVVSGRCAGLEALLVAATFVQDGTADRVVAGGGEGLHEAMRQAWREERSRYGEAASGIEAQEAAAALVLSPQDPERPSGPRLDGGTLFFEPDAGRAAERLVAWVAEFDGCASLPNRREPRQLCIASLPLEPAFGPALERGLSPLSWVSRPRAMAPGQELFAAAGPVAVVEAVRRIRAGEGSAALVVARDPDGSTCVVVIAESDEPRVS
ncbi:MAG: beta-ketoacyl synthase N-terminal-like domain-containing protein [Thermoanaerobaculia bacterium]